MRPIEMPLKSNLSVQPTIPEELEAGETAESISNLRILLNKISKLNFARISDTILNNFTYNDEILQELSVRSI